MDTSQPVHKPQYDHHSQALTHQWVKWLLIFVIATLLGLFDASRSYVYRSQDGRPIAWWAAITVGLSDWYIWTALAPLIFRLGRLFPLDRPRWLGAFLVHVTASGVMCLAVLMLNVPLFLKLRETVWAPITAWRAFHILFTAHSSFYMLNYWGILAVSHTLDYYRKFRQRELRTSQLEARLAQAQLQVLKMQLHPHFLFNTLNAISALMHRDVEIADRMIARLGELLRLTLASAGAQEVPLKQELDFIKPYLEIEQARLGPRLQVITQIEPATLTALVPNLILQPLVENAVRHGIAPRAKAGRIEIRAYRAGDQLHLEVWDDGPGLTQAPPVNLKGGIGLANTRARLQQLYGPAHRFDLRNGDSRGLVVTLEIPFHEDPVQPANDRNGKAELPAARADCLVRS